MSRIIALGDSHLDRLRARSAELACPDHPGSTAANHAVGGSTSAALAGQIERAGVGPGDRVVISIGTNDAASWHPVDLASGREFVAAALDDLLERGAARVVLMTTPGVDRARLPQSNGRTEADLRAHADAYAELARARGVVVLVAESLLSDLGPAAFTDDGLHLSRAGYDRLLPALAALVCGHP